MNIFKDIDPESLRQACDWLDRHENDTVDETEFGAWSRNPKNIEAWIAVNQFESLFEVKKLLDDYLKAADQIGSDEEQPATQNLATRPSRATASLIRSPPNRRTLIWSLSAAAAVGAFGIGALVATAREMAETRVGERKTIDLPGGSQIDLNTDTKVFWKVNERTRRVWLERGEVVLVAENNTEPFVVKNGSTLMVVNSGLCNLRKTPGSMVATVMQGQVSLRSGDHSSRAVEAGKVVRFAGDKSTLSPATPLEMSNVVLWRKDRVSFDGMTLGQAVEEYNRYLSQPITVEQDLQSLPVELVGSWSTTDPTDFLESISAALRVKIVRNTDGIQVTR